MESPGATKSGLMRPSNVGPPEENCARFSCKGDTVSSTSFFPDTAKVVLGSSCRIASNSCPSFKGMPSTGIVASVVVLSVGTKKGVRYTSPTGTKRVPDVTLEYDGNEMAVTASLLTSTTAAAPAAASRVTRSDIPQLDERYATATFPETSFDNVEQASDGLVTIATAASNACTPEAGDDTFVTALIARISPLMCAQCAASGPPMSSAYTPSPVCPSSSRSCERREKYPRPDAAHVLLQYNPSLSYGYRYSVFGDNVAPIANVFFPLAGNAYVEMEDPAFAMANMGRKSIFVAAYASTSCVGV
mmetsp:Transcript_540/g.2090  ORF Transcript_540/g.2090 Transcript_540/m.2090 type:complete len:303 (-) Transcript_540:736-1644(-)